MHDGTIAPYSLHAVCRDLLAEQIDEIGRTVSEFLDEWYLDDVKHQALRAAEDYRVELPPKSPAPEGQSPEEYAALLGVPKLDPRKSPDSLHPFHLLRDELDLLHVLIEKWGIVSLGQLETLLDSRAAPDAVPDDATRLRLRQRCRVHRNWSDYWSQGRGQPVDRGVLEQSGAVSSNFIDAASDLAHELDGDGRALIEALRQ